MRKRKTLPKDFGELLRTAPLAELKEVFRTRRVDAYGGYSKNTAIGFPDCPDELIVWLVEQGLDVDTPDDYGGTPLWERASLGRVEQIPLLLSLGADIRRPRQFAGSPLHGAAGHQKPDAVHILLEHGADVHATNETGETPLDYGLARTSNTGVHDMAQIAQLLIDAGATVTATTREEVRRIGRGVEFHRSEIEPDFAAELDAGLAVLYRLSGVAPVAARQHHDGHTPIVMPAGSWQEQHDELWQLLVPSTGAAETVQGEVIRITGRIAIEVLEMGAVNWDRGFRLMLDSLPGHFATGTALPTADLTETAELARALRAGNGDDEQVLRLCELAVAWVAANPAPVPLPAVDYAR